MVTRPSAPISGSPAPLAVSRAGHDAWLALVEAHAATSRAIDAELRARTGMSRTDYEVLVQLRLTEDHRLRMNELASRCGLSNSGLSRRFDSLVEAGWTMREPCPRDARGTWAVLTPQGAAEIDVATRHHAAALQQAFLSHFDDREIQRLSELLGRLGDGFAGHGS